MCNTGAQASPPSYVVNTPPKPQNGMSKLPASATSTDVDDGSASKPQHWAGRMKGLGATPSEQKLADTQPRSAGSSITAVEAAQGQGQNSNHPNILTDAPFTSSPQSSGTDVSSPQPSKKQAYHTQQDGKARTKTKYEEWYPGDASHDGRPAWWNRLFCCGYGIGCLLCPCSGCTCQHERS
ncbi:hypothetical protein IAT40_000764 [Kwoniella sp. CBS 6097]